MALNIDGKNLILGRLATVVAKKAILGEKVNVFNCNEVVITGKRSFISEEYKQKREMGTHSTGPFHARLPFKFVKRSIRGMLPYKKPNGRDAFDRIKCFNNIPEEFKDVKLETIEKANIDNSLMSAYLTVKEICKLMGGNVE